MSYITEKKIDFLRDLANILQAKFPFIEFGGRTKNSEGIRNGIFLKIFGDIWSFRISRFSSWPIYFSLVTAKYNNSDSAKRVYQEIPEEMSYDNIDDVGDFIYKFYFHEDN